MKKIFLLAMMAVFTSNAFAQLLTSSRTARGERAHNIWVDLGVGGFTGDAEDTGAAVDLGLRWTKMFTPNLGWDILKISAQTDTKHFGEMLNVQAKTGIRGVTPVLFGKSTLYVNFAGGYGQYTDSDIDEGGFVWEIGAGINFSRRFSFGINYNCANVTKEYEEWGGKKHEEDIKIGIVSARLSYAF